MEITCFIRRCLLTWIFYTLSGYGAAHAQSSLQQLDVHILQGLEPTRTSTGTDIALFIAKANNYVNAAVPAGLLVAGLIRNDADMKQNVLYTFSSTAVSYLLDYTIKKLVKRPRPFLTTNMLETVLSAVRRMTVPKNPPKD